MSVPSVFDEKAPLLYLGLPLDYSPSPKTDTVTFLTKHLSQLPPHLLLYFSYITDPKQRGEITTIRNRRLRYTQSNPPELKFDAARNTWPTLWQGRERRGIDAGHEEKEWVQRNFLQGTAQHIGKLGSLLGEYEEEREADRARILRRERAAAAFIPEEDESSSDEEDEAPSQALENESEEELKEVFERLIRERFIYGLLENIDYDRVDWDESLDVDDDRESEDRWFDEDDED